MTNLAELQTIVDKIDKLVDSLPAREREIYQKAYDEESRKDTAEA